MSVVEDGDAGGEEMMAMRSWSGTAAAMGVLWLLGAGAARAASIDIGSAAGTPGQDVTVDVSLQTMGASVLGTQNQIGFDRDTPVAARLDGSPDCAVNPAINKNATGFRFHPLGCDPAVDCQAVRVFVLAFDNLAEIADGSVLYSCRIAIAANAAPGSHALRNSETSASAADGVKVPTTGSDGAVEVGQPTAEVHIGTASAPAGTTTTFAVVFTLLTLPPSRVAGVQNDLTFDALTPVASDPNGEPACTGSFQSSFAFLPQDCSPGIDCNGVRALVQSGDETIPNGATLYSCQVAVAADAPIGSYPLVAGMTLAKGSGGEPLPILASDGAIDVTEPPPPVCVGDCDGGGSVTVDELLVGVNIAIGSAMVSACPVFDVDGDGSVAISELVQAVRNALGACPQ
jgi:hypothetical protein